MSDDDLHLAEPFDIEPGDLDGMSGDYIWCLAVDWADFRNRLMTDDEAFEFRTHAPNRDRFAKMAARHGRKLRFQAIDWDHPAREEWLEVVVDPRS